MKTPTPLYVHDCDRCRYLGTINSRGEWGDLYVCERNPTKSERSAIFRWSDEGRDYSSAPMPMTDNYRPAHPLRLAASIYRAL